MLLSVLSKCHFGIYAGSTEYPNFLWFSSVPDKSRPTALNQVSAISLKILSSSLFTIRLAIPLHILAASLIGRLKSKQN
jgi:hypothetical protein